MNQTPAAYTHYFANQQYYQATMLALHLKQLTILLKTLLFVPTPKVTKDLRELDLLRQKHRHRPNSRHFYNKYMDKLAQIQTQVSRAKTDSEKSLVQWQKEYFLENNFLSPTLLDMKNNPVASAIVKQIKTAKFLLREWKIEFN